MVQLSKTVCGAFHYRFRLGFVKLYILLSKNHELFDFKTS